MNTDGRPHRPQSWEHLLDKDPHSGTGFRLGIAAALLVHAGIFAITWPTIAQAPPREPEQVLIPLQLANLIPPDPEPEIAIEVPPPPPPSGPPVISSEPNDPEPIHRPVVETPEVPDQPVIRVPAPVNLEPPPEVVDEKVVIVGVDIDPPKLTHEVQPRYTEPARHAGVHGAVILELIIDSEGRVESVTVLRGLSLGLTRSAVDAVEQWQFEPSTYKGKPVTVRYILTVHFNLT